VTALMHAVATSVELVRDLLAAKATVHPVATNGSTALLLAASNSPAGVVAELLAAKASTEEREPKV
jgi:hypothetical protein